MLVGGLAVSATLNYVAGGAFQSRYSAIVFPFFVLLVARGFTMLRDPRIFFGVLAATVVLGLAGGARNSATQRTQAGEVARILRAQAQPGDLIVYCPDQLGPAVHRLLPDGLTEVVYPTFAGPERVDWVDYKERRKAARPGLGAFAEQALARAGDNTLWFVSAPGYITHVGTCESLSDAFAKVRTREPLTLSKEKIFEKPALQKFAAARSGG
jgi:hypothetical protein